MENTQHEDMRNEPPTKPHNYHIFPIVVATIGLTFMVVAMLSIVFTLKFSSSSVEAAKLQPIHERVDRLIEQLETMDRRSNAQYGNLKQLINSIKEIDPHSKN